MQVINSKNVIIGFLFIEFLFYYYIYYSIAFMALIIDQ